MLPPNPRLFINRDLFGLNASGTTVRTEIVAGISTYLSVAYIFVVNPAILAIAGIDPSAALFATIVAATTATLAMGLWANLPFVVAPGLTMNSYFVFVVCQKLHFTWQQGLAIVFLSGIVCVIFTAIIPLRQRIIAAVPLGLKKAIALTVGAFIATIGLFVAKIISYSPQGLVDLAKLSTVDWSSGNIKVLAITLVFAALLGLKRFRFPAGILVAIIVGALACNFFGIKTNVPSTMLQAPLASVGALDFSVLKTPLVFVPLIVFFVLDFFEGIGEFIGLTANTSIQDKEGNVRNVEKGLFIDGAATMLGSLLGTSSLIIFVESAVGIRAGGRTGLTALTCAILMLLTAIASIYFAPILALIPPQAVAGVLVYVGYVLLSASVASNRESTVAPFDFAIGFLMSLMCVATLSLDKALAIGFFAYFIRSVISGKPVYWLLGITVALSAQTIWQILSP